MIRIMIINIPNTEADQDLGHQIENHTHQINIHKGQGHHQIGGHTDILGQGQGNDTENLDLDQNHQMKIHVKETCIENLGLGQEKGTEVGKGLDQGQKKGPKTVLLVI